MIVTGFGEVTSARVNKMKKDTLVELATALHVAMPKSATVATLRNLINEKLAEAEDDGASDGASLSAAASASGASAAAGGGGSEKVDEDEGAHEEEDEHEELHEETGGFGTLHSAPVVAAKSSTKSAAVQTAPSAKSSGTTSSVQAQSAPVLSVDMAAVLQRLVALEREQKFRDQETADLREELALARLTTAAEQRYPTRKLEAERNQHEFDAWRKVVMLLHRIQLGDDVELVDDAVAMAEERMTAVVLGDRGEWAAASMLQGTAMWQDAWLAERADEIEKARRDAAAAASAARPAKDKKSSGNSEGSRRQAASSQQAAPVVAATPASAQAPAPVASRMQCFHCHGLGHRARDCPSLPSRATSTGNSSAAVGSGSRGSASSSKPTNSSTGATSGGGAGTGSG